MHGKSIWKDITYTLLKAKIVTAAAKLKASAQVSARTGPHIKAANDVFTNQFGISGALETWITLDRLYRAIASFYFIFFFYFWKKKYPSTSAVYKNAILLWSSGNIWTMKFHRISFGMGVSR